MNDIPLMWASMAFHIQTCSPLNHVLLDSTIHVALENPFNTFAIIISNRKHVKWSTPLIQSTLYPLGYWSRAVIHNQLYTPKFYKITEPSSELMSESSLNGPAPLHPRCSWTTSTTNHGLNISRRIAVDVTSKRHWFPPVDHVMIFCVSTYSLLNCLSRSSPVIIFRVSHHCQMNCVNFNKIVSVYHKSI
jgi:hypothetical protein